MEEQIICVKELSKKYKDFKLQDISFNLNKGYIMGLIGRNGAGKTTLMDCILGKNKYEEGYVQMENRVEQYHANGDKEELGLIMEPGPFFPLISLEDNADRLGIFYKNWDKTYFLGLLKQFHLDRRQKYYELSKGMKTKFQLAFALAHHPKLLVLDEPTGGLDPVFRKEFLSMIQSEVRDSMMSVIISTHLTADLDKVADYILMLDEGKQLFFMDKEEMLDSYPIISGAADKLGLLPKEECGRIRKKGSLFLTMMKNPKVLREHPEWRKELQVERTTIDEIMYYLSE